MLKLHFVEIFPITIAFTFYQSARAFHNHSNAHDSKAMATSVRCLRDIPANTR